MWMDYVSDGTEAVSAVSWDGEGGGFLVLLLGGANQCWRFLLQRLSSLLFKF